MGKKNIVDMTHARKNIPNLPFDKMFLKTELKKKDALFRGSVVIFCYFFFLDTRNIARAPS